MLVRSRKMSARWLRAIGFVVPTMGMGACSLINSFGDVRTGPADGSTDTTGVTESGSESGHGESGTEGGFDSGFPDKGCIVISGRVSDDAGNLNGVLTAISPYDGTELPNAREMLNVPVAQYDGLRDLWIIIETNGQSLFPTPSDKATLHLRTLDPVSGTWATLGSLSVPPPVFGLAAVLKNRLVYVGFDNLVDSASGTSLVTIDTSDPTNPNIYASLGLVTQPTGIIGTRSGLGMAGGPVNMLESVPCGVARKQESEFAGANDGGDEGGDDGGMDAAVDGGGIGGGLCLAVQQVTVPASMDLPTLGKLDQLGPFFGRAAYGSYLGPPGTSSPLDVIGWAVPGSNPGAPGATTISQYNPLNYQVIGQPISFQTSDGFFQPFAFSECYQQLLVTGTNEDLSIYAIPFSSPSGETSIMTQHSGQSLAYEPYTNTVLSPFTQGEGYVLDAFYLTLNNAMMSSPQLTLRTGTSSWNPPADVRPELLAIRKPLPIKCPP
jgi:hypothetical protein